MLRLLQLVIQKVAPSMWNYLPNDAVNHWSIDFLNRKWMILYSEFMILYFHLISNFFSPCWYWPSWVFGLIWLLAPHWGSESTDNNKDDNIIKVILISEIYSITQETNFQPKEEWCTGCFLPICNCLGKSLTRIDIKNLRGVIEQ